MKFTKKQIKVFGLIKKLYVKKYGSAHHELEYIDRLIADGNYSKTEITGDGYSNTYRSDAWMMKGWIQWYDDER